MNSDLNLLPSQAKFQAAKIKLKKKVKILVWVLVIFWVVFLLVIFSLWFIVKTKLSIVDRKYKGALNQFQSMKSDVLTNQQIKYQAKLVGKVLADRFEYGEAMEKINKFFSSNIVLEKSELNNKKKFELEGKIINGRYLDEVESKIIEINSGKSEGFANANLTSLAVDGNNIWTFEMEVEVK